MRIGLTPALLTLLFSTPATYYLFNKYLLRKSSPTRKQLVQRTGGLKKHMALWGSSK